jgi:hypothetical protein
MKRMLVYFISLLTIPIISFAQEAHGDYLFITANAPIDFSYNTADELIQDKIISNAFELKLNSKAKTCSVYANLLFSGSVSNGITNQLALKLNHKNSASAVTTTTEIPLIPQAAQMLFTQPQMPANSSYYSFSYDLILHHSTSFINPANYNFSIIFTMTQP